MKRERGDLVWHSRALGGLVAAEVMESWASSTHPRPVRGRGDCQLLEDAQEFPVAPSELMDAFAQ